MRYAPRTRSFSRASLVRRGVCRPLCNCSAGYNGTTNATTAGELRAQRPELLFSGCTEIEREEEEDGLGDVQFCDPRPTRPNEVPVIYECSTTVQCEDDDESCGVCPDCCALQPNNGNDGWVLDASAGIQTECYDADLLDPYAVSEPARVLDWIEQPLVYPNQHGYTIKSGFACECPPPPPPKAAQGFPVVAFLLFLTCCVCFSFCAFKLRQLQKRHSARFKMKQVRRNPQPATIAQMMAWEFRHSNGQFF